MTATYPPIQNTFGNRYTTTDSTHHIKITNPVEMSRTSGAIIENHPCPPLPRNKDTGRGTNEKKNDDNSRRGKSPVVNRSRAVDTGSMCPVIDIQSTNRETNETWSYHGSRESRTCSMPRRQWPMPKPTSNIWASNEPESQPSQVSA